MTGKVVILEEFRKKKLGLEDMDLNDFLQELSILSQGRDSDSKIILEVSPEKLKEEFRRMLLQEIAKQGLIDSALFKYGLYVADLLSKIIKDNPESWFAIDYLDEEMSGESLRRAANICFLLSSIFQERAKIRCMQLKDYQQMGAGMYYMFYSSTGREIGFYMSRNFKTMADITLQSFQSLR